MLLPNLEKELLRIRVAVRELVDKEKIFKHQILHQREQEIKKLGSFILAKQKLLKEIHQLEIEIAHSKAVRAGEGACEK